MYHVTPDETLVGFDVYCDMTAGGGGWLVGPTDKTTNLSDI